MKSEWAKAYDAFKITLTFMNALGENTTETNIVCAMTLSKLNRYQESFEFAERGIKAIERELKIDPKRPISDFKYQGKDREMMSYFDKQMTNYAIGQHILGMNMANLNYFKQSKAFLLRAQHVASAILIKKKPDLLQSINRDLNEVAKSVKVLPAGLEKKDALEDIEGLLAVKTELANKSLAT
jgi:hypothetical protein